MKTLTVNEVVKVNRAKKDNTVNPEAIIKLKTERGVRKEKFDRNFLSEDDLDRILACC